MREVPWPLSVTERPIPSTSYIREYVLCRLSCTCTLNHTYENMSYVDSLVLVLLVIHTRMCHIMQIYIDYSKINVIKTMNNYFRYDIEDMSNFRMLQMPKTEHDKVTQNMKIDVLEGGP